MKKWIALLLALLLCLGMGITCPAEEARMAEYVSNGDFETASSKGAADWTPKKGAWGTEFNLVEAEDAPSGKNVLQIKAGEGSMWAQQRVTFLPNTEYTMTFKVKPVDSASGAAIKFEFYRVEEGKEKWDSDFSENLKNVKENQWNDYKTTFKTGENVAFGNLMVRIWNGGEYYLDDVSVRGPAIPDADPVPLESMRTPVEGTENLITNSGFETMNADGYPEGWKPYRDWEKKEFVYLDDQIAYEGKYSVRINTAAGGSPWVMWMAQLEPNTTYQLSAWVRVKGLAGTDRSVRFKKEYYRGDKVESGTGIGEDRVSFSLTPKEDNRWVQVEDTFTTPEGTQGTALYCRLHANGTVWFDDVQLHKVSETAKLLLDTDQYFYYPDLETGYAEAKLPVKMAEELRGGSVDFALLDTDKATVLKEQKDVRFTDDKAYFDYPISLLAKEKTPYFVQATIKDADGNALYTAYGEIAKYPRPSMIGNTGMLNTDGKPLTGTFIYHAGSTWYDMCEELGFDIILMGYGYAEYYKTMEREQAKANLIGTLDDLQERGMKAIIAIYPGMKPAGHPDHVEYMKMLIEDAKDHPAVLGYATQDEPSSQVPEPEHWMKESYKAVRSVDDIHPVYMLNAEPQHITRFSKFCDIFAFDPYPEQDYEPKGSFVAEVTSLMRQATEPYGKPTVVINQAFAFRGYTPTKAHLRSFWYQTLMEDGTYPGWYALSDSTGIQGQEHMKEFYREFKKEEQAFSMELFGATSTLPLFNTELNEQYSYKSVLKDGSVYMLILNRLAEEQEISIPLISRNGLVTAAGAPEELYALDGGVNPRVENGNLIVTMPESAVALIKIGSGISPADLNAESFTDLAGYDWAKDAIEQVYRADIAEAKGERLFAPGDVITRGEFARFLIRALDLNALERRWDRSFTDVPADAPYYREVCIGKYLGILRGVDDEHYNPEAPITRQDLMVICARGLHYKLQLGATRADLAGFSDNALVADYAESAVAEMIAAEIIRGNADGTINPLGNTTRAEAAVIMQRIVER